MAGTQFSAHITLMTTDPKETKLLGACVCPPSFLTAPHIRVSIKRQQASSAGCDLYLFSGLTHDEPKCPLSFPCRGCWSRHGSAPKGAQMQPLSLPRVQQVPQQVTTAQGIGTRLAWDAWGASIRMTVLPFLFRQALLCDMFGSLPGSSLGSVKKNLLPQIVYSQES